jgi:hypothetical protein
MSPIKAPFTLPPINFVEESVAACESARRSMNVPMNEITVGQLRKLGDIYYMRHGAALNAAVAMFRVGKISPVAYNAFVERVRATLVETIVDMAVPR